MCIKHTSYYVCKPCYTSLGTTVILHLERYYKSGVMCSIFIHPVA